ncbi:MAG TPA: carboxymuconolactone decarboxylase family protein [Terrimicrobiaceae bacterium]|nr:carboxymuconolactone decarboxylase family protein [Terrimicrobiaceae bacterium]
MTEPLPLPSDEELPPDVVRRLHERPPIHVFRMLAHAPECVVPFTDMIRALYQGTLSPRMREIAILRQAAGAQAPYEIHQHTLLGRSAGLTDTEIAMLLAPEPVTGMSPEENLVCAMCDQLEHSAALDDPTFARARAVFAPRQFVEILLLIGMYSCVARFLNGTRLAIESDNPLAGRTSPN